MNNKNGLLPGEEEILQEYLKMFPKEEKNDDEYFLFSHYSGKNGNKIKAKQRHSLKYFMELNYLDTLFISSEETEFWEKFNNSVDYKIYLWGSSLLFDFNESYYYELRGIEQVIIDHPSVNNGKIIIAKINIELQEVETDFEVDIIIL